MKIRRIKHDSRTSRKMKETLNVKVDQAIRLLRSIPTDKGDIEVSYSGGLFPETAIDAKKF